MKSQEEKLKIGWLFKNGSKTSNYVVLTPYSLYFYDSYKEGSDIKGTFPFTTYSKVTKPKDQRNSFIVETGIQSVTLSCLDEAENIEDIDVWVSKIENVIKNYTPNFTKVNKDIFDTMKTDQGPTVSELCDQGAKVLLYFLNSVGCMFCQGRMLDMYNMYESLSKLNVAIILLYNESTENYKKFLQMQDKEYSEIFYSMKQTNSDYKYNDIFDIHKEEIISKDTLKLVLSDNFYVQMKRLKGIGIKAIKEFTSTVSPQVASVFLIQKKEIIFEYKPENTTIRFDFSKIIFDPLEAGIPISNESIFDVKFQPKALKKTNSFTKRISSPVLSKTFQNNSESKSEKTLTKSSSYFSFYKSPKPLKDETKLDEPTRFEEIIKNPRFLKFFKVHLSNEFALENIIFYEEVQKYKKLDLDLRKKRINEMIESFFRVDSRYQINTSQKLIEKLMNEKENADEEIFSAIEKDVYESCFIDAFIRFKKTNLFQEMLTTPSFRKSSYSIIDK